MPLPPHASSRNTNTCAFFALSFLVVVDRSHHRFKHSHRFITSSPCRSALCNAITFVHQFTACNCPLMCSINSFAHATSVRPASICGHSNSKLTQFLCVC